MNIVSYVNFLSVTERSFPHLYTGLAEKMFFLKFAKNKLEHMNSFSRRKEELIRLNFPRV